MSDLLIWTLLGLGLLLLFLVIGLVLPRRTTARWVVKYRKPKDLVWSLITDHGREATWRPELARCERLPDESGRPAWREHRKKGPPVTIVTRESNESGGRLVRATVGGERSFTWTYDIAPAEGGCSLAVTEQAEVRSVLLRIVWHVTMRKGKDVKTYLTLLSARLGENVTPKSL